MAVAAITLYDLLSPARNEGWIIPDGGWSLWKKVAVPNPIYTGTYAMGGNSFSYQDKTLGNFVTAGLANQEPRAGTVGDPWAAVSNGQRTVAIGRTRLVGGTVRMQWQEAYTRPNTGAFTKPTFQPARFPVFLPSVSPEEFPLTWPATANPHAFQPNNLPLHTAPVPWKLVPDWTSPNRQASYGWSTTGGDWADGRKVVNNWSVTIATSPSKNPDFRKAPSEHIQDKPPKKEKEYKVKVSRSMSIALGAISTTTEALDMISAIYDALPVAFRPRFKNTPFEKYSVTPYEKMQAIIKHHKNLDIGLALWNILNQQADDTVVAMYGKAGGRISKDHGHFQYGAGINRVSRLLREGQQEAQDYLDAIK